MSDDNTASAQCRHEYEGLGRELATVVDRHPRIARRLEALVWTWIAFGVIAGAGTDLLENEIAFHSLRALITYFVYQAVLGLIWFAGTVIGVISLSELPDRIDISEG